MGKIEEFKNFVKNNPNLIRYVDSNEMSWQKFYELYDLYGEESSVWENYTISKNNIQKSKTSSFNDMFEWLKNIDIDSFQNNINSIQRVLSVLQELGTTKNDNIEYKPRPIYKHFED